VCAWGGFASECPNRRSYEWPTPNRNGDPRADVTIEVLPTAWGFLGGTLGFDRLTNEPITVVRCGVKLQMVFSGQVGKPSAIEVIRRVIEGIVLFGVAEFLTRCVARWLVYGKRFEDITRDKVDMERAKVFDKDGGLIGQLHHTLTHTRSRKVPVHTPAAGGAPNYTPVAAVVQSTPPADAARSIALGLDDSQPVNLNLNKPRGP
jgi:hypothetical protein